jgi:hypothetical protein
MRNWLALLLISVLVSSCGGGSAGSGGNPSGLSIPVGTVSGTTFDGLISSANVSIYDFTTGAKGAQLAQSVSDGTGHYSISLKVESRPILIEITGGSYFEEAGAGYQIALNNNKLTALTNYTSGTTVNNAVTTFTHMAAGLAAYQISKGTAVAVAIDNANGRVSTLTGFDILTTMPVQITAQINGNSTLTPELRYGFLAGAISSWTYSHAPAAHAHVTPYTSIDFAQLIYQDISADGILDGKGFDGTGSLVQLSFGPTPLNVDVYRFGIGAGMIQMAANARNKSSLAVADVLPFATSYIASTDAMFNGVAPAAFVAPTVTIAAPVANSVVNGLLNVAATTDSNVGLAKVELLVDTVLKATATNLTAPTFQIDTTAYVDGIHSIGVAATDLTGKVTTRSVSITINNTAPAVSITAPVATAAGPLTISATTNSSAGLSKVELLVDDVSIAIAASVTAPTFTFNTTVYSDGVHTISVRATSLGGLVSISSVQVAFLNNPPVVSVSAPAVNGWLTGSAAAITATATSANMLTSVEFLIDGTSVGFAGNLTAPAYSLDTTALTDGTHTVIVRATDNLGLVTSTASRTFRVDNTLPTALGSTPGVPLFTPFPPMKICAKDALSGVGVISDVTTSVTAAYGGVDNTTSLLNPVPCGAFWTLPTVVNDVVNVCDVAGNCTGFKVCSGMDLGYNVFLGLVAGASTVCPM